MAIPTSEPPAAIAQEPLDAAALGAVRGWDVAPQSRRHARERRIARDLVELSRLQRGSERAERSALDLGRLVAAIRADYPQLETAGPPSVLVNTDSRRLARILFALLDNAHLHGAPPVTLSYDQDAIVLRDGGPGFAPVMLARATEPFVTAKPSRGRGVGLGLAIAARQAALIGATLELANGPAGGAVVTLRLPASPVA
jgi:signal transduction histidine kinase